MHFPLSAAVFLACLVSTNADFRQRRIKESGRVSSGYRDGEELFDMRLCLAPSLVTNCLVRGLFRASYARNVHGAAVSESRADSKRDPPRLPECSGAFCECVVKFLQVQIRLYSFRGETSRNKCGREPVPLSLLDYKAVMLNQPRNLIYIRTLFTIFHFKIY